MAKPPGNTRKETNAWDASILIVNRFVASGYAIPFLIAATLLAGLWIVSRRLESKDLKELTLGLADRFSTSAAGWILFAAASVMYFVILVFIKRQYEGEISRQRDVIDKLLARQPSDNLKLEEKQRMENFLFSLLLGFSISVAVLWAYWVAFYPAIILKARFRIMSIQDEVRLSAQSNRKIAMTRAYLELDHFFVISRRVVQHHDIIGLYFRHPQQHEIEEVEQRIRVIMGEPELAEHFRELTRWMFVVRIVSAPTYLCISAFLVVLSLFSDWARNLTEKKEKEAFTIGECLPA